MTARYAHTAKKHSKRHFGEGNFLPSVRELRSNYISNVKNEDLPFLAWPFYLFDKLMKSWRGNIVSVVSPADSWQVGNRITIPKSESRETDKAYHYQIELPGTLRDQIALNVKDGILTLQAKTSQQERKKGRYYRHSHSIRRAFSLPVYTNAEAITAELKNGVLTITIPKTDQPMPHQQARTIEVT